MKPTTCRACHALAFIKIAVYVRYICRSRAFS